MEKETNKEVKLDEAIVTQEEFQQRKQDLKKNERIVEVTENEFKTVKRLQG